MIPIRVYGFWHFPNILPIGSLGCGRFFMPCQTSAERTDPASDSPPDRDLDWTEAGIEGAWRYINRLWRMVSEPNVPIGELGAPMPDEIAEDIEKVRRSVHQTVHAVSSDLDKFHFNKDKKMKTLLGGFLSLLVYASIGYILYEKLRPMIEYRSPNIQQIQRNFRSDGAHEVHSFNHISKVYLEVWNGQGESPSDLFQTVPLDRDSRKYINVHVKYIIEHRAWVGGHQSVMQKSISRCSMSNYDTEFEKQFVKAK